MSIAATALAEAPIAFPDVLETSSKTPPKRRTIATADTALVPEPR